MLFRLVLLTDPSHGSHLVTEGLDCALEAAER